MNELILDKLSGNASVLTVDIYSAFENALSGKKLPPSTENGVKDMLGDTSPHAQGESILKDTKKTDSNTTNGAGGNRDDEVAEPKIDFPDFKEISGNDITKFLKDNDLLRFDGPLADKMEKVFIKNIDSSEFFRKAVIHGFETEGKKMTFGSDPDDASEGAAAYATSRDGRNFIWLGNEKHARQDLIAHEFFHAALGTDDGGTKDDLGDYGEVPGSNQIAEAAFAEEAGIEHGAFDLYKNGEITQASDLNIDFDKFMENKDNDKVFGQDGSKDYDYKKLIENSGNYESFNTDEEYDDRLNRITEGIRAGTDVDNRKTKYLIMGKDENNDGRVTKYGEQFMDLAFYYLSKDPDMSAGEVYKKVSKDLKDRLGNFKKESDVFNGYIKRHGGDDHMKYLADQAYKQFNFNEYNKEQWK